MDMTIVPVDRPRSQLPPVIALVGKPGVGKTTIAELLSDLGCDTISVEDESIDVFSEAWFANLDIENPDMPVVIDGLMEESPLSYLDEAAEDLFVLKVDVSSDEERRRRFIEKRFDELADGHEVISSDVVSEVQDDLKEREAKAEPLPQHHLTLMNDDSTETTELIVRLDELCSILT